MNYLDKRIDNTNCQVNIVNRKIDILHEEIKAYSASGRKRASDQDLALQQLDHRLTAQSETHIETSQKQSDSHEAALRQLDNRLSSRLEAFDEASKKRSDSHTVAIGQLEDRLTSQMVTQKKVYDQENATLRKHLDAIKTELTQLMEDADARDAQARVARENLAKASKEDLVQLTQDMRGRYVDTQRALTKITSASNENAQVSTEIRTAMQRLIDAHAFFVRGDATLVETLEAEKDNERPKDAESVLGILYEQRKAQLRLLNEMQDLLSQALSAAETSKR